MAMGRTSSLILGGAALVAAILIAFWQIDPVELPKEADVAALPPSDPTPEAEPAVAQAAPDPAPPEAAATNVAVDLFRVEPDGSGIVAGRAAPGSDVEILIDGAAVGTGQADESGSFVGLFTVPLGDAPQVLTLGATAPNGTTTTAPDSFVVQPSRSVPTLTDPSAIDPPETDLAALTQAEANEDPALDPLSTEVATNTAPDGPAMPERTENSSLAAATDTQTEGTEPETPVVLRRSNEGLQVIQSTGGAAGAQNGLSIDTITYDDSGDVILGGRSGSDVAVQVYIDNRLVEAVTATPDGQWRVDLPDLDSRVYTLRVDTLGSDGLVLARAETPFRPEEPSALARLERDADGNEVALVTVQPGFTLWRIADENYGDGFDYVRVFDANTDKIRDPDLIYPGQVFTVPDADDG